MIKLSIIWDEKRLADINSEEILKEMVSFYSEFRKELSATSASETGSIFIGLATESDSEMIKNLLNLPSDFRSVLLDYIKAYIKTDEQGKGNEKKTNTIEDENAARNEKLKNLFLPYPHKDIEIVIDRPIETGRDIHL